MIEFVIVSMDLARSMSVSFFWRDLILSMTVPFF